jgi:hypothetical protein
MPDYSVNATQLQSPQGAGSSVIAPVTASILDNGVAEGIGNIFKTYAKGLEKEDKAKAEKFKSDVLGSYAKKQARINDAIATGAMPASEAASRSRALSNEYFASYPELIGDLEKTNKAFRGATELGEAEDLVKAQKDERRGLLTKAQSAGYPVHSGMDEKSQNVMIEAWQSSVRAEAALTEQVKRNTENRAMTREQREIADAEAKSTSIALINDVAQKNLPVSFTMASDLATRARKGEITFEDAKLQFGQYTTTVESQIQALSAGNPELASGYRSLFKEAFKLGEQALDPAADSKAIENEVQKLINQQKLLALTLNPKVASAVAVSEMFRNSPEVTMKVLGQASGVLDTLVTLQGVPVGGMVPTVTGSANEKPVLDTIKKNIQIYNNGTSKDNEKLKMELTNSTRNFMVQLGELYGKQGVTPEVLKESAAFFADPQFGKFMQANPVNASEIAPVKQVFQMQYENKVVEAVDKALDKTFRTTESMTTPWASIKSKGDTGVKPLISDTLTVNFDGATVSFGVKKQGASPEEQRTQRASIQELNTSAAMVNQLVRIAAHLEGSTDYKAVWEARKHILLPKFFSAYEGLEIGQTVDGKRYLGGNPKSASSWE